MTPRFNSPTGSFSRGHNAYAASSRRSAYTSPYTSLPFPFFGDSFNPDDIYSTGYPVASQPPAFVLQAANALSNSADYKTRRSDREVPPPQPLMIELQNGRYVRIHSTPSNGEVLSANLTSSDSQPAPISSTASPATHDLPAAVLIFRDGHSEEVRDYSIADGILYARGDYYTDGYWNKKIALATLNVPETMQANNARNVKFVLPASANEVITRP
jgi:hypothetical protein